MIIGSKKLGFALLAGACLVAISKPAYCASPELSPAEQIQAFLSANGVNGASLVHQKKVMIPMRDGVRLTTDIFRLNEAGKRYPVILVRTPYGDDEFSPDLYTHFIKRGYAIVLQTERGLLGSEGTHSFLAGARKDGWDTLSWISAQPWSSGRIAMFGCSSSAESQLALSTMGHPALRAVVVGSAGAGIGTKGGVTSQGLFYRGGVPALSSWVGWYADLQNVVAKPKDFETLPSSEVLPKMGVQGTLYEKAIQRTPASPEWLQTDYINEGDQIKVPMLNINSWYDVGADETLKLHSAAANDTGNAYLIMGPGQHCAFAKPIGMGAKGVASSKSDWGDIRGKISDWIDHWINGRSGKPANFPPVQVFLPVDNRWIKAATWPLTKTVPQSYYLTASRGLVSEAVRSASSLQFVSDPARPVPSVGELCCSDKVGLAQNSIEKRADVLTFTTAAFTKPTKVIGPVKAQFYVSTTVPDADLSIKMTWVDKQGVSRVLYETMMRLRYRDGFKKQVMMPLGVPQLINVDGLVTSHMFKRGERLRIQVSGSNFPSFERNMQTGGSNSLESRSRAGTVRLHFGPDTQSKIEIPILAQ